MDFVEKLVELVNEILLDCKPSTRKLIGELLTGPESTFVDSVELPEDLIVSSIANGVVRISMLGLLNTALQRTGEERKIIVTVDEDDQTLLMQVELGPYPKPKRIE